MTPQDFCYWLQGFSELNDKPPNAAQWKAIQDHLALTFTKVTPQYERQQFTASPFRDFTKLALTC